MLLKEITYFLEIEAVYYSSLEECYMIRDNENQVHKANANLVDEALEEYGLSIGEFNENPKACRSVLSYIIINNPYNLN